MKNILLCFLTNKKISDAMQTAKIHFGLFTTIDPNHISSFAKEKTQNTNGLHICFTGKLTAALIKDLSLATSTGSPRYLPVLLIDRGMDISNATDLAQGYFDIILVANGSYAAAASVIEQFTNHNQLQKELDSNEKKYNRLVNNLPGITYRCKNDSDWTMLFLSRKSEKITGYPAKAFINNKEITYSDIIFPGDRERVWLSIQKAIRRDQPFTVEYRITTASGRVKWVWEQGRAHTTRSGEVVIEGVILDIDQQKSLETRLQLMREIVLALSTASDLVESIDIIRREISKVIPADHFSLSLFDRDNREFLVPYMENEKEYFKKTPMGKTLDALVIKRNRPIFLKSGEIKKLERQGKITLDGPVPAVWLGIPLQINEKASGIIVLEDFNNAFAIVETDVDLLDFISVQVVVSILRKQAEEESEKLLQALKQSPVAAIITDLKGHIVYANNKASVITGYAPDEMKSRIPNIIEPYKSDPDHYTNIWKALNEKGAWEGEFKNRTKTGEEYWEYARISSIKNVRGNTTHYLYLKEEITERKNIERELIKAKKHAEESDKLKSSFLANISYEIRTPMNAIIGFTEMLRGDDYSAQEHEEFFNLIIENCKKLLNTIDNIIDIAKIEAGQMTISNTRCSANKILYDNYYTFESMKKKLDKDHIDFTFKQFRENENLLFYSDPVRINQVLANMLENAFKYSTEGAIEFGYTLTEESDFNYIDFYVRDSGASISNRQTEAIFNQIEQKSKTLLSTPGGAGLGLAISRNIARLMNGDIRLESKIGQGSAFHFLIPYNPVKTGADVEDSPTYQKEVNDMNWPDKTILIVEDEDSNFKLLEIMLRKTKVTIQRAFNGKQAVDYISEGNKSDLILMDVRMPVMNGYEATERIKKMHPKLPVIIQTAFALSGDREHSFEAGCDAYLSKPIKATDLYHLLKKFIQ
jgi:PAS domain S-box-containing protein